MDYKTKKLILCCCCFCLMNMEKRDPMGQYTSEIKKNIIIPVNFTVSLLSQTPECMADKIVFQNLWKPYP